MASPWFAPGGTNAYACRSEEPGSEGGSDGMPTEIVAGLIGAAATALLAILNSYLTSRAQVAEEVRKARLDCYTQLWTLTSLVSGVAPK